MVIHNFIGGSGESRGKGSVGDVAPDAHRGGVVFDDVVSKGVFCDVWVEDGTLE